MYNCSLNILELKTRPCLMSDSNCARMVNACVDVDVYYRKRAIHNDIRAGASVHC